MNIQKLAGRVPASVLDALTPEFLTKAGIDGPKRLSHFIGQTEEETGKYTRETENLNYSAEALLSLFPKHFDGASDAANYARKPEQIANRIYADRMGNGPEESGDGWKYRGRGDLQLTGKAAYQAYQDWLNVDAAAGEEVDLINNPDLVATAPYDLLSAAWFFSTNHLWPICDKGVDVATITEITKHVNGGTINLDTRIKYTQDIYNALTA